MSIISSPEMFINMKKAPTPDSSEYGAFVRSELDKLQYGTTINGIYISNWLYWHLNYWKIYRPEWDERRGEIIDVYDRPQLRDNEWMIAEALTRAKKEQKGLLLVGTRRLAKTSIIGSYEGLGATIYEGSQNIIVGNNKNDIKNITTQMDKGLNSVEDYLRFPRILNDWRNEVVLGTKDKKGNRDEWSHIHIRNTEDGNKTEVLAGLTPKTLVFDEIGKADCIEMFLAAIPAFASPYGWRCSPLLFGTGGDMQKGKDAEEMFHNPERYNLLAFEVPGEKRNTGMFLSGLYSVDVPKNPETLSEYLHIEKGSELDDIIIHVADREKGLEIINNRRESFLKAQNQIEYLKAVMYAPLTPDECFMSNAEDNPFPVEALKQHLEFLKRTNDKKYVKLFRDVDGKINWSSDNKLKEVTDFPVNKDSIKEGAIVVYELPIPNAPPYLYIGGSDPYNQNESLNSPSLGTVNIYKRMYDPVNGTFQHRIVASYASRPSLMKSWHENVEMLLEFYNATLMIENEGTNFIQYLDGKNKSHLLADGYSLMKEINPKSTIQGRIKGLPATVPIQRHYNNLIIQYCTEEIILGEDVNNKPITAMGLTRIPDEMLITELINYRPKLNTDRRVAFGHVLVYNEYLDKMIPNIKMSKFEEVVETKKTIRNPFNIGSDSFKRNVFGV